MDSSSLLEILATPPQQLATSFYLCVDDAHRASSSSASPASQSLPEIKVGQLCEGEISRLWGIPLPERETWQMSSGESSSFSDDGFVIEEFSMEALADDRKDSSSPKPENEE